MPFKNTKQWTTVKILSMQAISLLKFQTGKMLRGTFSVLNGIMLRKVIGVTLTKLFLVDTPEVFWWLIISLIRTRNLRSRLHPALNLNTTTVHPLIQIMLRMELFQSWEPVLFRFTIVKSHQTPTPKPAKRTSKLNLQEGQPLKLRNYFSIKM